MVRETQLVQRVAEGLYGPENVRRAAGDFGLSDLNGAGLLVPEQSDRFIQTLIEQPTIMKECRVVPMRNPQMEVNKLKFGTRILHAAAQSLTSEDTYPPGRWLIQANRSKIDNSKVTLSTHEVIAEVRLPYEVLEDNIERENFSNTLLTLIAGAAARDLEELIIQGNTGNGGDPYLALLDGILIQATTNVVDAQNDQLDANILTNTKKALPHQFFVMPGLKYYTTTSSLISLRTAIAARNTGLGDMMLSGQAPVMVQGHEVTGVHKMPTGNTIFTDPKNIIVGFHRDVRIEMDRDIRAREMIFVLTARVDVKLEEETAFVKVINLVE